LRRYDKSWKLKDYTYSVSGVTSPNPNLYPHPHPYPNPNPHPHPHQVTRIFMGNVNPNAFNPEESLGGVNIVEGRMELYDERVYTGGKVSQLVGGTT
jgi:hypothetical protein